MKFIIEGTNTNEIKKFTDQLVFWTKPNKYGLLNDNQTIILINFLLCFVSNDNLFIQSIIISIISFYATFTFYKSVNNNFSIPPLILYLFIFFNPSYLIWTSGNFKETFIYIGLVFLFSNLLKLSKDKTSIKFNILIFINLIFILLCKNYFFIFLSPGIIAFYSIIYFFNNKKINFISISYLSFILLIISTGLFYNPVNFDNTIKDPLKRKLYFKKINSDSYTKNVLGKNRNLFEILKYKQRDHQFEAKSQNANTLIFAPTINGNPITVLKCIPFSLINTVFRPNFIDLKNPFFIPDIFSNIILWILIFFAIKQKKEYISFEEKLIKNILFYFILISLILIGILVPVLGNIVRYKAPLIPLLNISLLVTIDFKKINFLQSIITNNHS